jgi:hypothetical protein
MRDAAELILEVRAIMADELVGDLTADAILACVTALEIAKHGSQAGPQRAAALEYRPADLEAVQAFVDRFPDLSATATEVYRGIYSRDPSAAEARTVAVALRRLGLASARSNGRTVWRHP